MKKAVKISNAEQVVQIVREAIQNGAYRQGDRLPTENELAEEIGVGRSSVREGMRILAGYGIVEVRQGEGTFVSNMMAERVFSMMGYESTENDFRDLSQLRHICEIGCLGIVLEKGLNKKKTKELENTLELLKQAEEPEKRIENDFKFHQLLFSYTENVLLIRIYQMISQLMKGLMSQLMTHEDVYRAAVESHEEILFHLKNNDVLLAEKAMTAHLDKVDDFAVRYF